MIFKNRKFNLKAKYQKGISFFAKYCFGIYLVHMLIVEIFEDYIRSILTLGALFAIPAVFICVTLFSFILSYIIKSIPLLGKYIA